MTRSQKKRYELPLPGIPGLRLRGFTGFGDGLAIGALSLAGMLAGCASTGAPRAPSLLLPQVVRGVQAARVGSHVDLQWTTPTLSTDRQPLVRRKHGAGQLSAEVCRAETAECKVVRRLNVTAGQPVQLRDDLPPALLTGAAQPLRYEVRTFNGAGHTAGWSRDAVTVSGPAPEPLTGLTAATTDAGVQLTWKRTPPAIGERIVIEAETTSRPDAAGRSLGVRTGSGGAIDTAPHVGDHLRYTVTRTRTISSNGTNVAISGEPAAIEITRAADTFAPAQPKGLIAVAMQLQNTSAEIDLSWEPNNEADLQGYLLYRTEAQSSVKLTPKPIESVSFRDSTAQPGHAYRYTVTAIDRSGNESARSEAAEERLQ